MDDYISREEAVKKIKSCISTAHDAWESGYNTAMAEIMEWIQHIPAADVQSVKHAHFEEYSEKEKYEVYKTFHIDFDGVCSECGSNMFRSDTFCAGCGVRMDGDSDDKP